MPHQSYFIPSNLSHTHDIYIASPWTALKRCMIFLECKLEVEGYNCVEPPICWPSSHNWCKFMSLFKPHKFRTPYFHKYFRYRHATSTNLGVPKNFHTQLTCFHEQIIKLMTMRPMRRKKNHWIDLDIGSNTKEACYTRIKIHWGLGFFHVFHSLSPILLWITTW